MNNMLLKTIRYTYFDFVIIIIIFLTPFYKSSNINKYKKMLTFCIIFYYL